MSTKNKTTGAYKAIDTLFCPTCRKPRDEVLEAIEDGFAVLRCLNCDAVLASGKFISFRAICPKCGYLVIVS
mgnify:CR=1 FL=1